MTQKRRLADDEVIDRDLNDVEIGWAVNEV